MRVFCPNCGTEFEVPNKEERKQMIDVTDMDVSGTLVPKHIHNDNLRKNINSNEKEKENVNMSTMNLEGLTMEILAKMVAEQIKKEATATDTPVTPSNTFKADIKEAIDGGIWAKTSQFYGKEICGFVYNPYMVRRFLPKQFNEMMNIDLNVNQVIRQKYPYMKTLNHVIKECKTLAMLEKRDQIAYDERKRFWSVGDIKTIFLYYAECCMDYINKQLKEIKVKDEPQYLYLGRKRNGSLITVKETIENHKLVVTKTVPELAELQTLKDALNHCYTYAELCDTMRGFRLIKIPSAYSEGRRYNFYTHSYETYFIHDKEGYELHKVFIENFKRAGAYYTIKNELMFNGATLKGKEGREAILWLQGQLYKGCEAYEFYAMLKEMKGLPVIRGWYRG